MFYLDHRRLKMIYACDCCKRTYSSESLKEVLVEVPVENTDRKETFEYVVCEECLKHKRVAYIIL